jgi:hypothetical protein
MRFSSGQLCATPTVLAAFEETGESPFTFIQRHAAGDWGDVCPEDAVENALSLQRGFRLLSSYKLKSGTRFWILTEADRSATTVLLPQDY